MVPKVVFRTILYEIQLEKDFLKFYFILVRNPLGFFFFLQNSYPKVASQSTKASLSQLYIFFTILKCIWWLDQSISYLVIHSRVT